MKAFLIFEFRFASSIKPTFPVACFVFPTPPHPPPLSRVFLLRLLYRNQPRTFSRWGLWPPGSFPCRTACSPQPSLCRPQMQDVTSFKNLSESGGGVGGDLYDIFHVDAICLSSKDWFDNVLSSSEENMFQAWRGKF